MAKTNEFNGFLSEEGHEIFDALRDHCRLKLKMEDVDDFELAMLANSFDTYAKSAQYCKTNGIKMIITTEKGGIYEQICPDYTVMKNEYQNILKHSGKFGLNPGDRSKIFKKLDQGKKGKAFDMKVSKTA